jgi:hypothetical protein
VRRRRFPVLVFAVVTAAVTCCGLAADIGPAAGATSAAGSVHPAATSVAWGNAQPVPNLATLNAGDTALVNSVSCASAGNCAAGGLYRDSADHFQGWVADEVNGTWGDAEEVPNLGTLNAGGFAEVLSVSCASAGNCAVGGEYEDSSDHRQGFVADQASTSSTWGNAEEVPNLGTLNAGGGAAVDSVSCVSAGNCAAGGSYTDSSSHQQGWVANETTSGTSTSGTWGNAEEVPNLGTLNAGTGGAAVDSVSCVSAGNCAAGGSYHDSSGHTQGFVADEAGSSWGNAEEVPNLGTLNAGGTAVVTSVSCASAGNCAAGGSYENSGTQGFVVDQASTSSSWGNAEEVPNLGTLNADGDAPVDSVSCVSAGTCTASGSYHDSSAHSQGWVANETTSGTSTSGTWGNAEEVPNLGTLNAYTGGGGGSVAQAASVSCGSAGNCAAGGAYTDSSGHLQGFVADEAGSSWGNAEEVPNLGALNVGGTAEVRSVSCVSAGNCAAGGLYTDSSGHEQGFVVDGTPTAVASATTTSVSLSAASGGLQVTATVAGPAGSTTAPAGTVTFTDGSASLGSATLKAGGSGTATASVMDHALPAGANDFTATFSPSNTTAFAGSTGTLDITLPVGITWVQPGSPTISGTAAVGDTLTVKPGTWGPAGVQLAYQWYANGSAISGATGTTLGLGTSEFGKKITVTVTGFIAGDVAASATSPATGTVGKGTLQSSTPRISGTAKVGDTLKVSVGSWTSGTSFHYQWLANGKAISRANGSSLKLASAEQGKRISVQVTGSKTDYNSVTKTSAQTGSVAK